MAAALWLAAAAVYLGGEALAAVAFVPPYRYAIDYISDLGVPDCGIVIDGRAICSPRHALMNAAFVLHGLLFAAAALAAGRAARTGRTAFAALALTHGAGLALVAAFPTDAAAGVDASLWIHRAGALAAIAGGNAAVMAGARVGAALGLSPLHRRASLVLGGAGIAALLMLGVDVASTRIDVLAGGAWERISVYTIVAWEALTGAWLLTTLPRQARRAR
nr:DUF998 domain-containing protein [Schlegelella koreensis]